jgi:hypothetical protein
MVIEIIESAKAISKNLCEQPLAIEPVKPKNSLRTIMVHAGSVFRQSAPTATAQFVATGF